MNNSIRLKYRRIKENRIRFCAFFKMTNAAGVNFSVRLFYCDFDLVDNEIKKITAYLTFTAKSDEFDGLYTRVSKHTKLWKSMKKLLKEPIATLTRYINLGNPLQNINQDNFYTDIVRKAFTRPFIEWIASASQLQHEEAREVVECMSQRIQKRCGCKELRLRTFDFLKYSNCNYGATQRVLLRGPGDYINVIVQPPQIINPFQA